MGSVGVAPSEFWGMTPRETWNVIQGFNERKDADYRAGWEQTRLIATMLRNQWAKQPKSPSEFMPFPWDSDSKAGPADIEALRKEMGWQQEH